MGYMNSIFTDDTLNAMCELRGVFDPDRRSNPGKVVPIHSCREWNAVASARAPATPVPQPLSAEPARPRAE
jgi:glycolate oxidase